MNKVLLLIPLVLLAIVAPAQVITMVAGDTTALAQHHVYTPSVHAERVGPGAPVEVSVDLNLDGSPDLLFRCANSVTALGYGSYYLTVRATGPNAVSYSWVDSAWCFNGYKPIWFANLFDAGDTLTSSLMFDTVEMVISKDFWIMKDTCNFLYQNFGPKYLAVRLGPGGTGGLAWVALELHPFSANGYSADVNETGIRSSPSAFTGHNPANFSVYPNPSGGLINICIPANGGNLTALVTDLSGRVLLNRTLKNETNTLHLDRGVYLLKVMDGKSMAGVEKLVICE